MTDSPTNGVGSRRLTQRALVDSAGGGHGGPDDGFPAPPSGVRTLRGLHIGAMSIDDYLTPEQQDEYRRHFEAYQADANDQIRKYHQQRRDTANGSGGTGGGEKGTDKNAATASSSSGDFLSGRKRSHVTNDMKSSRTSVPPGYILTCDLLPALEHCNLQPLPKEIEAIITEVDVDGSGLISLSEFLVIITHQLRDEDAIEDLKEAFRTFDTMNPPGSIEKTDFKSLMTVFAEVMTLEDIEALIGLGERVSSVEPNKIYYDAIIRRLVKGRVAE